MHTQLYTQKTRLGPAADDVEPAAHRGGGAAGPMI